MPAERIAESLSFINWTVLTCLGVGSFVAVVAGRLLTDATRGYLAFTALSAGVFGALAALSDGALPSTSPALAVTPDPTWELPRHVALAAFPIIAGVYAVGIALGRRWIAVAVAGLAAAAAVLVAGAFSWGGGPVASLLLLGELATLAIALGGVWASMILGHWYLVTPRLPEAPLVRFARWLAFAVAAQLVLFLAWTGLGAGPAGSPGFGALVGPWALFVWLRLLVGLVFPLVVSWAAIQTARSRSMESATGLLYINVGTIAAGTILAAGLYFGAGLLV